MLNDKMAASLDLIRFSKPYGTFLLLAPALWSLVIASNGAPSVPLILVFVLGTFLMRSAGCAVNDIADIRIDSLVERTRNRPLPSGRLTIIQALFIFLGLSLIAFGLIWALNPLTRILSVVALLLAVSYPFTKRFIKIPQLYMGLAFGWGAIMAWTAVRNTIELPAVSIFFATICWATAYDTIYSLIDRRDDARLGIGSSALLFGEKTWLVVGILFAHSVVFLVISGVLVGLGPFYYGAVLIAGLWFAYQTVRLRMNPDSKSLFRLFKSNVGVGLIILAGIFLSF